jgi:hypothetical protein
MVVTGYAMTLGAKIRALAAWLLAGIFIWFIIAPLYLRITSMWDVPDYIWIIIGAVGLTLLVKLHLAKG